MESKRLKKVIEEIDRFNSKDPRQEIVDGVTYPQELIYSKRLSEWVLRLDPNASEALRVVARGQHIGRWTIPRDRFEMDRGGYLRWRETLKSFHAQKVAEILQEVGYAEDFIKTVRSVILKKSIKQDADTQTLEDSLCLIFLETQCEKLQKKEPVNKMKDIVRKTWRKMGPKGREMALQLHLPYSVKKLLEESLSSEVYGEELSTLLKSTRSLRDSVVSHLIYKSIVNVEQVCTFMEHHVFAVWDFMTLAKFLQKSLTCTSLPWIPQGDPRSRRLINEIILDEESDETGDGEYISHFELYLEGMQKCGADTTPIKDFITRLEKGDNLPEALHNTNVPEPAKIFVEKTWGFIETKSAHKIAAVFTIAREDIIPEMFQKVIRNIQQHSPDRMARFAYYLQRHISVDRDRHGPMAMRMLKWLCEGNPAKWQEATEAAQMALQARLQLWDDVAKKILQDREITSPQ